MEKVIELLHHFGSHLGTIDRYIWVFVISMALAPIFYRDHQDFTKKGGK